MKKTLVITLRCGRLANRLIIFATFIAFAEEFGCRLVNFTFHSYADLFETTHRDIYCGYPSPKRRSWMDIVPGIAAFLRKTRLLYHLSRLATVINERLPLGGKKIVTLRRIEGRRTTPLTEPSVLDKIQKARWVFVYSWEFRAAELLQKHAQKVREHLRPLEQFERASNEAVERLRRNADVVIGVHIRHGDYRRFRGGKYFFPTSCYADWMRQLAAQFPDRKVSFLVCSDEPRRADEFPGLTVGFGTDSPVGDLYALSKCDYIIGPVSTFSQWASFYGGKPLFHLRDRAAQIRLDEFRVSWLELAD